MGDSQISESERLKKPRYELQYFSPSVSPSSAEPALLVSKPQPNRECFFLSLFFGRGLESAVIDSREAIQVFWRKKTETREAAATPPTLSNLIFVETQKAT